MVTEPKPDNRPERTLDVYEAARALGVIPDTLHVLARHIPQAIRSGSGHKTFYPVAWVAQVLKVRALLDVGTGKAVRMASRCTCNEDGSVTVHPRGRASERACGKAACEAEESYDGTE